MRVKKSEKAGLNLHIYQTKIMASGPIVCECMLSHFSHVRLFATLRITARQASLSITNFQSLLRLMSIELVRPSNHLILCHLPLLLPSIFPLVLKQGNRE